jgi:hypothetical protein
MVFNATLNNISVISWWLRNIIEDQDVKGDNY